MKFNLVIWNNFNDGARHYRITGFLTLEDAIDAGIALARRRSDGVITVKPAVKDERTTLVGIYSRHMATENLTRLQEHARAKLVEVKAELKAKRARYKFVRTHGGWGSKLIDRILEHEGMKAAFYGGDFATVERLMAESGVTV
jgi:hypothetical protein